MKSTLHHSRVNAPSKWKWHLSTSLRTFSVLLALSLTTLGLTGLTPASAGTTVTWSTPTEVVGTGGTGGLGDPGNVQVMSLSCATAGNCSAGGYYYDGTNDQAFVVNEVNGVWATPIELVGTGGTGHLGDADYAEVLSLSCTSAGNCSAGGYYALDTGNQAFVVNEVSGTWGTPMEVIGTGGTGGLGDNGGAQVTSLSCSSAGNCSAGGHYFDGAVDQAFVVNEVSGTWGTPIELTGTAGTGVLGFYGGAEVSSISCSSAGNCSAGGSYYDGTNEQAFVVNDVSGTWGTPIELAAAGAGVGFLGDNGGAHVLTLSCSSNGNCSAGGYYDGGNEDQAFVISEVSGTWGTPAELTGTSGTGGLGDNNYAEVLTISCPSDGNCSAGGYYYDDNHQAFVVNEVNGFWGTPIELTGTGGTGVLGDSGTADVVTLSCSSAGNCAAAGSYYDGEEDQAFVVNEIGGVWGTPVEISGLNGTGGLGDGGVNAQSQAISCSTDGYCAVGGIYDVEDGDEAFVASATTVTTLPPPPPTTSTTTTTTTTVPPTTTTTMAPVTTTTTKPYTPPTTVPKPKGPETGAGGTASPTHSGGLLLLGGLLSLLGLASIAAWFRRHIRT